MTIKCPQVTGLKALCNKQKQKRKEVVLINRKIFSVDNVCTRTFNTYKHHSKQTE